MAVAGRQFTASGGMSRHDPVYRMAVGSGLWKNNDEASQKEALRWAENQYRNSTTQQGTAAANPAAGGVVAPPVATPTAGGIGTAGAGYIPNTGLNAGTTTPGGSSGSGVAGGAGAASGMDSYYQALTDQLQKSLGQEPEKVTQQAMLTGAQKQVGNQLGQYFQQGLQGYTPGQQYGGQLNTQATGIEGQGLNQLQQFVGQGKGQLSTAAESEALKTVQGGYSDAASNPYVQSLQDISQRNLQSNIDRLNRQRGGLGRYFTSETARSQDKLVQESGQDLNAQVAQFLNKERDRQTGAIGTSANLDKMSQDLQLQKVGASQQYGGLNRMIEGANLEKQYQVWLNSRGEQGDTAAQATGFSTSAPPFGVKTWYM